MSDKSHSEATPKGGASAADGSLAAAAAAFRSLPSLSGTPKGPGENPPPKPKAAQKQAPEVEPEVEETEETEQPEAEETTETVEPEVEETPEETTEEVESDVEPTEDADSEETDPTTVKARRLKFSDGTEEDVTEDEAYNGYLRTKDYTRKTQASAEARKRAEAAEQAASERASELLENLQQVKSAMDKLVPKEPNWPELRKRLTPEEFADTVADYQAFKAERDKVDADIAKVAKEKQEEFGKKYETWRKGEIEALFAAIPEWVDPKVGAKEAGEMASYARSIGFSEKEVDTAVDHRYLLLFRKAMLWDRAQKGAGKVKPKIVAKSGVKTVQPGGKKPAPKPVTDERRAQDNLRKSGTLDSAASVFSHVIKRGQRR